MMVSIRNTIINTPARKAPTRRYDDTEQQEHIIDVAPPPNRGFKAIPSDNLLSQLIQRALGAFKQGTVWDRGSILNIEV